MDNKVEIVIIILQYSDTKYTSKWVFDYIAEYVVYAKRYDE